MSFSFTFYLRQGLTIYVAQAGLDLSFIITSEAFLVILFKI
jgi:hypothetical protein